MYIFSVFFFYFSFYFFPSKLFFPFPINLHFCFFRTSIFVQMFVKSTEFQNLFPFSKLFGTLNLYFRSLFSRNSKNVRILKENPKFLETYKINFILKIIVIRKILFPWNVHKFKIMFVIKNTFFKMVLKVQNKFPFKKMFHKFEKCPFLRLKNGLVFKKCLCIKKTSFFAFSRN